MATEKVYANRGKHTHFFSEIGKPCSTCGARCTGCGQCICDLDRQDGEAVKRNVSKALTKLEGMAEGGPRDGVKLTASARWDGRLHGNDLGHYVWGGARWVWVAKTLPAQRRAQTPQARSKKVD